MKKKLRYILVPAFTLSFGASRLFFAFFCLIFYRFTMHSRRHGLLGWLLEPQPESQFDGLAGQRGVCVMPWQHSGRIRCVYVWRCGRVVGRVKVSLVSSLLHFKSFCTHFHFSHSLGTFFPDLSHSLRVSVFFVFLFLFSFYIFLCNY